MHTRALCAIVALAATLLLALVVNSATAGRFSLTSQTFRITWQNLQFFYERPNVAAIECPATMEGSFHSRTIAKVPDSLLGYVTRAIVNEGRCSEGSARFLPTSLPWHIRYRGFNGILPRIQSLIVRVGGIAYETTIRGQTCLFRENGTNSLAGGFQTEILEESGQINFFEFESGTTIARFGGALCLTARSGLQNGGLVTVLNSVTKITLRLI